jgi:cbb3-type cytochrome oxidase maturation protein
MSVIYIVLPLALLLAGAALAAFLWAVRKGQFDDLDTPAIRIALEDDVTPVPRPERPIAPGHPPGGSNRDPMHV